MPDSSDFEFDSRSLAFTDCRDGEGPVSPKLLNFSRSTAWDHSRESNHGEEVITDNENRLGGDDDGGNSYDNTEMEYYHVNGSSGAPHADIKDQKKPYIKKWAVIKKLDFLRKTVPRSRGDNRAAEKLLMMRNQETTQPLDYAATAGLFESPRESMCSSVNYSSSTAPSPTHHDYTDHCQTRNYKSAPMRPIRTPPESPSSPADARAGAGQRSRELYGNAGNEYSCRSPSTTRKTSADHLSTAPVEAAIASPGAGDHHHHTRTRVPQQAPRSPHARHYEQQRARAEQLKRRTSLPYRQSSLLMGACFFFPSDHTRAQIVQQVW